jgi:hypothetical protein
VTIKMIEDSIDCACGETYVPLGVEKRGKGKEDDLRDETNSKVDD